LRFIPQLAEAGCDLVLFHAENVPMLYETIFTVREHDLRVGLVLGLGAPLHLLEPVVPLIDAVLLLARVTGEGARGATFNPLVLSRLAAVAAMARAAGTDLDVQVAGGVNRNHVAALSHAGATALALGAGLYKAPDMAREVAELRALAHAGVT
jgi:ribulose-phosphate 3-epimerase